VPLLLLTYGGRYTELGVSVQNRVIKKPIRQTELYPALELLLTPALRRNVYRVPEVSTEDPTRKSAPHIRGLLLIAEDNTVNQKIVLRMLSKLGYRADVAGNGSEAVSAVRRIPYDAVLMDCQMPEMDGFEATAKIRERELSSQHIPIIAMTAHALKGDRERCLEAGMDDYIAKPIKLESIKEVLDKWLPRTEATPNGGGASNRTLSQGTLDVEMLSSWRDLTEDGENDFLTEVIDIFLENTPPMLKEMNEATKNKDARTLQRLAHKLKGSSSNLGAKSMAELCATLEEEASRGQLADAPKLVRDLEGEFAKVSQALRSEWRVPPTPEPMWKESHP
jgi:CheY-like chemotaxis protein/HPt (histidine-containing phosphotransfer) domain-containing protein